MKVVQFLSVFGFAVLTITTGATASTQNLSCYQCIRDTETECNESDLRPCKSVADRCVTHIKKDPETGFLLKRECGLGPCSFDDDMASKSLGWDNCDRSKNNYFCVICCKGNGCNKSSAAAELPTAKFAIIAMSLFVIILLEIIKGYQPPYTPENSVK